MRRRLRAPRGPRSLPEVRRGDHRAGAVGHRARGRLRDLVPPGRRAVPGPGRRAARATRGLLARRLARSRRPARSSTSARATGRCSARSRARGREAVGLERRPSDRPDALRGRPRARRTLVGDRLLALARALRDAGAAVDHAAGLLDPDGLLVIAMPNPDSLQARAFGDRWFGLDLPRHLVHVPAPALVDRLESLGLEIERVSHGRGGQVLFGWLHGLVGLPAGTPEPLRRDPAARGARRRAVPAATSAARARRRDRRAAARRGRVPGRAARAPGRHGLRRGAAWLTRSGPGSWS